MIVPGVRSGKMALAGMHPSSFTSHSFLRKNSRTLAYFTAGQKMTRTREPSVGGVFVSACICNLHQLNFPVNFLPNGNIGRMAFFQVAMVNNSAQFAIIRPVAAYRAMQLNVHDKSIQGFLHDAREL